MVFIGMFPLPEKVRDPAEVEEEQRMDAIRAKQREYNRRYQAKRKVKDKVLIPAARQAPEEIQEQQTKTA